MRKKKMMYRTVISWFFVFFFLLFGFSLLISYSFSPEGWFLRVFQARFMYFPLLFYLVIFAFLFSVMTVAGRARVEKKILDKMENVLTKIAEGRYTFSRPATENEEEVLFSQQRQSIQHAIAKIQTKLIELSKQAMDNDESAPLISGKTEEEILKNERHRIARELHDSVSQQLFAAMMLLSAINQQSDNFPESTQKQLLMIQNTLNEAQSEMRALLLHLRPINLEERSLKQGIEHLLKELSTKISSAIKWNVAEVNLPPHVEDHLFRIVQELLSNILRHAKADEMELYLTVNNQTLSLIVMDDGVGFDLEEKKTGSYGLSNVRERIQGLGGTTKIISFPNQGTKVELTLPIVTNWENERQ